MNKIAHLFIDGVEWKVIAVVKFDRQIRIPFCPPLLLKRLQAKDVKIPLKFFIFEISIRQIPDEGTMFHERYDLIDVK